MKKTISILSIIAIVIASVALLMFVGILTVFWEPMCLYLDAPQDIIKTGPVVPIGTVVYVVGCLLGAVATAIFTKLNKSVVFEIIAIVLLSVVIPLLFWRLTIVQTTAIGNIMGVEELTALSVTKQMGTFANGLTEVAETLCLVVCGMSISEKIITKKAASNANE